MVILESSHHSQTCYEIERLLDETFTQPYAPQWDSKSQGLFFSDYVTGNIYRFDWIENRIYTGSIANNISTTLMVPLKGCNYDFAISDRLSIKIIRWNWKETSVAPVVRDTFTVETDPAYELNNWNIVEASPTCHFYGGTFVYDLCENITTPSAAFYSYNKCKGVQTLARVKLSGGIAWNVHEKTIYHVDSCNNVIMAYDWNPRTDQICRYSHSSPCSVVINIVNINCRYEYFQAMDVLSIHLTPLDRIPTHKCFL